MNEWMNERTKECMNGWMFIWSSESEEKLWMLTARWKSGIEARGSSNET